MKVFSVTLACLAMLVTVKASDYASSSSSLVTTVAKAPITSVSVQPKKFSHNEGEEDMTPQQVLEQSQKEFAVFMAVYDLVNKYPVAKTHEARVKQSTDLQCAFDLLVLLRGRIDARSYVLPAATGTGRAGEKMPEMAAPLVTATFDTLYSMKLSPADMLKKWHQDFADFASNYTYHEKESATKSDSAKDMALWMSWMEQLSANIDKKVSLLNEAQAAEALNLKSSIVAFITSHSK